VYTHREADKGGPGRLPPGGTGVFVRRMDEVGGGTVAAGRAQRFVNDPDAAARATAEAETNALALKQLKKPLRFLRTRLRALYISRNKHTHGVFAENRRGRGYVVLEKRKLKDTKGLDKISSARLIPVQASKSEDLQMKYARENAFEEDQAKASASQAQDLLREINGTREKHAGWRVTTQAMALAVFAKIFGRTKLYSHSMDALKASRGECNEMDLEVAVGAGDVRTIAKCILQGISPTFTTLQGDSPLHIATRFNNPTALRLLLMHRLDTGISPKARAQNGISRLLSYTVHKTRQTVPSNATNFPVNVVDTHRQTPLHVAAHLNHVEAAAVLLEHGASSVVKDEHGSTPLHLAAAHRSTEVATLLVGRGNSPMHYQDEFGSTPLHNAAKQGNKRMAQMLLAAGADPRIRDKAGRTPIECAEVLGTLNSRRLAMMMRTQKHAIPSEQLLGHYTKTNVNYPLAQTDLRPKQYAVLE